MERYIPNKNFTELTTTYCLLVFSALVDDGGAVVFTGSRPRLVVDLGFGKVEEEGTEFNVTVLDARILRVDTGALLLVVFVVIDTVFFCKDGVFEAISMRIYN